MHADDLDALGGEAAGGTGRGGVAVLLGGGPAAGLFVFVCVL